MDDVVGVAVGLGKNQRFGGFLAGRENLRFNRCFHGLDDLPDLAGVDHRAVKLLAGVGRVFFGFLPALLARLAVAVINPLPGLEFRAFLGDVGFDQEHVVADVDAVNHRLLVAVLGDDVLVEKAKGALVGRGTQADQAGVEVVEHLLPQVVDAAVAFVDDDEVERLHGHRRVVANQLGLLGGLLHFVQGNIFGRVVDGFARQHGIHALDGRDDDLRMRVDGAAGQALHVVQLGEFSAVVGRGVSHELLVRLPAKVARVHQKQNAFGLAELEQTINRGDGGEGLARAGRHVNEGARLVQRQRGFEPGHGADLATAQVAFGQRGHVVLEAAAQRIGLGQPLCQGFGLEEMKDFAGAWCGVAAIGEADELASAFKQKRQRGLVLAPFERGAGVALGLRFVRGEVGALLVALGLDDAHGNAVDKQHVIGRAGVGRVFAHRNPRSRAEVDFFEVLHLPAGLRELVVDAFPGFGFWCHAYLPLQRILGVC